MHKVVDVVGQVDGLHAFLLRCAGSVCAAAVFALVGHGQHNGGLGMFVAVRQWTDVDILDVNKDAGPPHRRLLHPKLAPVLVDVLHIRQFVGQHVLNVFDDG